MRYSDMYSMVGNNADDAVEEFSKLAKTQEGTSLVKLAKGVSNTCKNTTVCHIPNILPDGSNLISEAKKYAGKILKIKDNTVTGNLFESIKFPDNLDQIANLSRDGKGFKFNTIFQGKNVEIRVSNPKIYPFEYEEGYMRIFDPSTGNNYSLIDNMWLPDKNALGIIEENTLKTHYHLLNFK